MIVFGQLHANLLLLIRRERVDDAVDRGSAPLVCSVPNTRWPVSAALMAASIVSRSRISPTSITSGSWRKARRRASAKFGTSTPDFALVHDELLVRW